ncbi:MAG: 30S ribosomal protein S7 [Dehalococcoidia bacterium]|nr:30S ribosomal protein S7 [Dehalococcoidia bacterium]
MPRRGVVANRQPLPDAKYNNLNMAKFINKMLLCGKKATAEGIVYGAMGIIEKQEKTDPVTVFEQALKNATPLLQVKARRVGGATYQVPVEVPADRALSLAMRWLISSSRSRSGKSMEAKLAAELTDAFKGQGPTIKKREDTHKMAEANRAFAHYRW